MPAGPDPASRNTHRLTTERLVIDVPEPGDALALFDLVAGQDRDAITATLIWDGPDDLGTVEDWIERCRDGPFGEFGFHWVIRDAVGKIARPGEALGTIGTRPHGAPARLDVGYWLGRSFWGRGVMSEALRAVLALDFVTLGAEKVEAEVFAHNERGRRLVEGVGMVQEGLVRRAYLKRGDWVDAALYGITRQEWEARAAGDG